MRLNHQIYLSLSSVLCTDLIAKNTRIEYCIVSIGAAATTEQYPKPEVIMRSETTDTKFSEYISKYLPFENIVKYCSDPICVKIN